ncbi:hypothetical protein [Marinobacter fonticola]|uniref:hypothetical protein n=1 Tax=Marinobacter fonticola TaxID=2603215 RepID=UPI0011E65F1B|nr:hypothetical protein [Marinobacter fonticola]
MPAMVVKDISGYKLMKISVVRENGEVTREYHIVVEPNGELFQVGLSYAQGLALLEEITAGIEEELQEHEAQAIDAPHPEETFARCENF